MVRFCIVPNCPNKSRKHKPNGVSVFSVPFDNPELLDKWRVALNVEKLEKSSGVCENHFREADVKKYCVMKDLKGVVIQTVRYQKPMLAKNCVPKPFDVYCKERKTSYTPNKQLSSDFDCDRELVCETENGSGRDSEVQVKKYGNKYVENSNLVSNTILTEDSFNILIESVEEYEEKTLFDQLMAGELNVKLPNTSWYRRNSKTGILFAYEEEISVSIEKSELLPTQTKRIFLTKDFIKIYFFKKELNLSFTKYPSNLSHLENLIEKVDALRICQGGPFINYKKQINVLLAFKDDNTFRWRHKNCLLYMLQPNFNCKECRDLFGSCEKVKLQQNVTNIPKILETKRIKL